MLCCKVHSPPPPPTYPNPPKKIFFLMFLSVSVCLSASVERFVVSRMRDFCFSVTQGKRFSASRVRGFFLEIRSMKQHICYGKKHCGLINLFYRQIYCICSLKLCSALYYILLQCGIMYYTVVHCTKL